MRSRWLWISAFIFALVVFGTDYVYRLKSNQLVEANKGAIGRLLMSSDLAADPIFSDLQLSEWRELNGGSSVTKYHADFKSGGLFKPITYEVDYRFKDGSEWRITLVFYKDRCLYLTGRVWVSGAVSRSFGGSRCASLVSS